jgi:hypothetical protein
MMNGVRITDEAVEATQPRQAVEHAVWSKRSCGLSEVELKQPSQTFTVAEFPRRFANPITAQHS